MSTKMLGLILVVAGVFLLLLGLFADTLGIGSATGFGWKQIAAVAVGAVAALAGAWLAARKTT